MKKLMILIAVALFAFGCEGPQGPPGRDGVGYNRTVNFTLYSQDWVKWTDSGSGAFLGWTFVANVPELTKAVYDRGICNVYVFENNIQKQLPVTVFNEADGQLYQGLIWYDMGVGSVAFYYQENDFQNENVRPSTMTFRIQLLL